MGYELLEHTADVGVHVTAPDEASLFAEAGRALFAVLVADTRVIQPRQSVRFTLSAARTDDLLIDWLHELLYSFEQRRLVLARFDVRIADGQLTATAYGETFDAARHGRGTEVKAITYQGLRLERTASGYEADVVLDV